MPSLWDAVRFEVDKETKKGLFILTGSSTPRHKGILHSGTGRFGRIRMTTMSLFETGESLGSVSLKELFKEQQLEPTLSKKVSLEELVYYVVRGGWPGSIKYKEAQAQNTAIEYLENIITEDMFKVDDIQRDVKKIRALIHSLARNECTLSSNITLAKDIRAIDEETLDTDTISEYLSTFERLFILDDIPAYNPNLRSSRRMLKSSKRRFADPSLAVAGLLATPDMLLNDLNTFGFLFESLCIHDLKVYAGINNGKLFHFRDVKGNEADAIIEFPNGDTGIFEIKLGMNQVESASKNLLKINDIFSKEGKAPKIMGVIVGLGDIAYKRDDGVYVLPITSLRD